MRIAALMQAVMESSKIDLRMLARAELTASQFGTLVFLRRAGIASVSAIAKDVGLSKAATSQLVEKLVERRLVRRTEDPLDRRRKRVELTDAGASLVRAFDNAQVSSIERLLACLPQETRARLDAAVREALAAVSKNLRGS
jgi:DNA-binding MarR family transcriptional regulator